MQEACFKRAEMLINIYLTMLYIRSKLSFRSGADGDSLLRPARG